MMKTLTLLVHDGLLCCFYCPLNSDTDYSNMLQNNKNLKTNKNKQTRKTKQNPTTGTYECMALTKKSQAHTMLVKLILNQLDLKMVKIDRTAKSHTK